MKKIHYLMMASVLWLAACSQDHNIAATPPKKDVLIHKKHYQKPGAALSFSHNYDGKSNPGDIETFDLIINPAPNYRDWVLTVDINTKDSLKISGNLQSTHIIAERAIRIPIEVATTAAGRFYINVVGSVSNGSGVTEARAYAIEMAVGNWKTLQKPHKDLATDSDGKPIIIMEAQEEIYNPAAGG